MNTLQTQLFSSHVRAMPIAMYPGIHLTGMTVKQIVTNASHQFEVQAALHERYKTAVVLTGMDLSVEAEEFGSTVRFEESEIPTVVERLITDSSSIQKLESPIPGQKRTQVYLDTARFLTKLTDKPIVLGGVIGPFSLAGRLFGVGELLELTIEDASSVHRLLEKTTIFLTEYVSAFKESGANGIILAEPTAGLLSPRALALFSSHYVKYINDTIGDENFLIALHNCGAKKTHIQAILQSNISLFHFGSPMDIIYALEHVDSSISIAGNLDPSSVFVNGTPKDINDNTFDLLNATSNYKNFVVSSGCDLPPDVTIDKLDAFYEAVNVFM